MLNPEKSLAFNEGWAACENGVDEDNNPYNFDESRESYDDWADGWCECNAELEADWDDDEDEDWYDDEDEEDDDFLDPI